MVLHLETAAHLFTLADIKSEPRNCEGGGAEGSWLLENPLARSLFIFVQFGTMHLLQAAKCGQNAQVATRLALE